MDPSPSKLSDPHLDVVFVHGLGSSSAKSWTNPETEFNWPAEMNKRPDLRAFAVDYFAPLWNAGDGGAVGANWQGNGVKLLSLLANKDVGKRPIVFVAHSLGGIVVKQALRAAAESRNPIFEKTQGVVFLATPHAGATIATIGTHMGTLVPAIGNSVAKLAGATGLGAVGAWCFSWFAGKSLQVSALTSQLRKEEPALLDLNRWYRTVKHIETRAYHETELTSYMRIVDPLSADPGAPGCVIESADGKSHITICKPANDQDELFQSLARIVESIRSRVQAGKSDPVMRDAINEILVQSKFARYRDVGNFEEISTDDRSEVEYALRTGFRLVFGDDPPNVQKQRLLGQSNFDIDKFALSIWLEEEVSQQLQGLVNYVYQAQGRVRSEKQTATLIPLFRAVRTLDHVLAERDYGQLQSILNDALDAVTQKHEADPKVDEDARTRKLLKKLLSLAQGFDEVRSRVLAN